MDCAPGSTLADCLLQIASAEDVATGGDTVRPGEEHLTATALAGLIAPVSIDDFGCAGAVGSKTRSELNDDGALVSVDEGVLPPRGRAAHTNAWVITRAGTLGGRGRVRS